MARYAAQTSENPECLSSNITHTAPAFSSGANRGTVIVMEKDIIQTQTAEQTDAPEAVVTEELLVEEISIDGMCGVY